MGFWYQDPASGRLELFARGWSRTRLVFYDAGKLDHCSSYVLTTGKAALTGAGEELALVAAGPLRCWGLRRRV